MEEHSNNYLNKVKNNWAMGQGMVTCILEAFTGLFYAFLEKNPLVLVFAGLGILAGIYEFVVCLRKKYKNYVWSLLFILMMIWLRFR